MKTLDAPFYNWKTELGRYGLNMVFAFNLETLPQTLKLQLASTTPSLEKFQSLILIGNGGKQFWSSLPFANDTSHPVDNFTQDVMTKTIQKSLGDCAWSVLYPGNSSPPLQQLGTLAGWHNPSPLGLGINAEYGLWFAYRAVILVDRALHSEQRQKAPSPCESCAVKSCIKTCPANAISESNTPNMMSCGNYRCQPESKCQNTCLARESCPVANGHRYSSEQTHYHYRRSLEMIKAAR